MSGLALPSLTDEAWAWGVSILPQPLPVGCWPVEPVQDCWGWVGRKNDCYKKGQGQIGSFESIPQGAPWVEMCANKERWGPALSFSLGFLLFSHTRVAWGNVGACHCRSRKQGRGEDCCNKGQQDQRGGLNWWTKKAILCSTHVCMYVCNTVKNTVCVCVFILSHMGKTCSQDSWRSYWFCQWIKLVLHFMVNKQKQCSMGLSLKIAGMSG